MELLNKKLYVIAVISNPVRYKSRYNLFKKFKQYIDRFPGAELITVEMAFGEREHCITEHGHQNHVRLSSFDELWHKENMINIGISRLPSDWEYMAWIDADVHFARNDWVEETLHQLQHHMFVQMFNTAIDLGPDYQALGIHNGFISQYLKHAPFKSGYHDWHPGFAWAARREAIEAVGGMIDHAILGSGDRHMACALIGQSSQSFYPGLEPNYFKPILQWQERADRHIRRDVGFVSGTLLHDWHGRKVDRQYSSRWNILNDHRFDPTTDLKRDSQGLWQLESITHRQMELRDAIRAYFRARKEDSIDLV